MFINFEKYRKTKLSEKEVFLLCAIKNKDFQYIKDSVEMLIEKFVEGGLAKYIKGKKQEPQYEKVRLTPKGEKLLKDLSSSSVSEDTKILGDWLINYYKNREGGIVKNKAETLRRMQWFSDETGLTKNRLAVLLKSYISNTYNPEMGVSFEEYKKENPRAVLSNMVDNVFWSPPNIYSRHYKIEESPLYSYYQDNIEVIENLLKKYNG